MNIDTPQRLIVEWRQLRCARGQSLAEFGLIVSAFIMLVFGVINVARAVYAYNTVCYAASTAIRYASLNGASSSSPATSATVQSLVYSLGDGLDASSTCPANKAGAICASTTWNPNNSAGSNVTVTVTYEFQPLSALLPAATLSLSSTETMVIPD
jgi:Flp pilus assembly protein TadG